MFCFIHSFSFFLSFFLVGFFWGFFDCCCLSGVDGYSLSQGLVVHSFCTVSCVMKNWISSAVGL